MKISPLNDRELAIRLEAAQRTAGGLIMPDNAKEKPQEGKVLAGGPVFAGPFGNLTIRRITVGLYLPPRPMIPAVEQTVGMESQMARDNQ